jgi:hypothetical protein
MEDGYKMVDLNKVHRVDEARYSKRQELEFVIRNRRNRLVALWVAERIGLGEQESAGYATDIVGEAIVKPGDQHMVKALIRDLANAGVTATEADLRAELERFHKVATMEFGASGGNVKPQPHAA